MKAEYIQGETIAFAIPDAGFDSVRVGLGAAALAMTKVGVEWRASMDSSALDGRVRWAVFSTKAGQTRCEETGTLVVRALASKWRTVVSAIEEALKGVATNGKYSVTVGEISIIDKTFDEMAKALQYYRGMAEEDETGVASSGRVATIQTRFA